MMENVHVMETRYESGLPYREEDIDGKLTREDERSAKAEKDCPYLVHHGIRIVADEMTQLLMTVCEEDRQADLRPD